MISVTATMSAAGQHESASVGQETNTAVKRSKAAKCNDCNIILNSEEQARSHYGGKSHQNRLKELGIAVHGNIPPNGVSASHTSKATVCTACKLTLNSEAQALQHYKGKSHSNRIKELELSSDGRSGTEGGVSVQSKPAALLTLDSFKTKTGGLGSVSVPSRAPQVTNFCQPMPINNGQGSNPFPAERTLRGDQTCSGGQLVHGAQPAAAPSLKRKATEVSCSACCLLLNSESQAELHFSSRRHIKRMKMQHESQKQWNSVLTGDTPELMPRKNRFYCQQCQLSVNSMSQLTAHMQGGQHRSKLQMGQHPYAISTVGQPGELSGMPTNVWTGVPGNKNGWFYCRQCDISVPTAYSLSQHIQSNSHLEQKYQSYDVDGSHDTSDNYAFPTWNEEPSQYYNDCCDYPAYVQY